MNTIPNQAPEPTPTRAEVLMQQAKLEREVCVLASAICGAQDIEKISRPKLYRAIIRQHKIITDHRIQIEKLFMELFCADPDHKIFKGVPETTMGKYRVERIKRLSGGE